VEIIAMMKPFLVRFCLRFGFAVLIVAAGPFGAESGMSGVQLAAAEDEEEPQKTRRVPTMSEQTFKKLSEAQELIDLKDYAGALALLDKMLERSRRMNGNEIGAVHNMRGFVFFSDENYEQAISAYEIVVAQGEEIPEGLEITTLYTLAQLSFVIERHQDALDYMETWLTKARNPGADPHIFMGQVYYQMENYPAAIDQIESGIRIAKERGLTVKENWWGLLNYLYFEQENWDKVLEILEILVQDFPKREYWIRLAGILGQEGNEKDQVHAMQGAYTAGFLDRERDLLSFAGLLMQDQVPFRAAVVLDQAFDDGLIERTATNLQSLGQAWQLSQETARAIPVFEEAADISDDGRIYERLAQLYLDDDQFDPCVEASDGALDKGGLRNIPQVHIIKGMCQFNAAQSNVANLKVARKSFVACRKQARKDEDTNNERICLQWITYIDREASRLKQLDASI
jgi:tetratricopeptide (TPR) repeat protein